MLNPTEYLFSDLKQIVKSKAYKQKRSVGSILIEQLEGMKERSLSAYYNNIRPYLELALRQKSFKWSFCSIFLILSLIVHHYLLVQ